MFAHNEMDGKISLLSPEQILSEQQNQDRESLLASQTFESEAACSDSVVIKADGRLFLISGFDDGVVCLLDLEKTGGASTKRQVYRDNKNAAPLGQGQYD